MHSKCHARNLHCTASCVKVELSVKAWVSFDDHRQRLLASCSQPTLLSFKLQGVRSKKGPSTFGKNLVAEWTRFFALLLHGCKIHFREQVARTPEGLGVSKKIRLPCKRIGCLFAVEHTASDVACQLTHPASQLGPSSPQTLHGPALWLGPAEHPYALCSTVILSNNKPRLSGQLGDRTMYTPCQYLSTYTTSMVSNESLTHHMLPIHLYKTHGCGHHVYSSSICPSLSNDFTCSTWRSMESDQCIGLQILVSTPQSLFLKPATSNLTSNKAHLTYDKVSNHTTTKAIKDVPEFSTHAEASKNIPPL